MVGSVEKPQVGSNSLRELLFGVDLGLAVSIHSVHNDLERLRHTASRKGRLRGAVKWYL